MRLLLPIAAIAFALAGCATTAFRPFETHGDAVFVGKGGARVVQDGMDVWTWGDPPRRYKVLGVIDDERPGGAAALGRLGADVVAKAREAGGQALIQVRSQAEVIGQQSSGSAGATGYGGAAGATAGAATTPVRWHKAQFLVIVYVDAIEGSLSTDRAGTP